MSSLLSITIILNFIIVVFLTQKTLYQKYHLGIHYLTLHDYLVLLHDLLVNQHCLVAKLLYQQNYCIIITRFFHFLFISLNNRYQCFKRWHLSYIWFDTLTNKKANFTVKTAGLMNFASFIVISKCIRHNLCDVSLSSFFR